MSARFTDELWAAITPTYDAILTHPFLTGLADGTLDPRAFAFYLRQDALYLARYARALAVIAGRAGSADETAMFARHAADAVAVERLLHESLLRELGVDPAMLASTDMAPVTLAYTSYLLATVHGCSYAEGMAAVLPCYWIYWKVGKALSQRGSPNPRYQRWIDTYAADEFGDTVRDVLAATNRRADELTMTQREQMRHHFCLTSRYEWMFWDMGYRREAWPV